MCPKYNLNIPSPKFFKKKSFIVFGAILENLFFKNLFNANCKSFFGSLYNSFSNGYFIKVFLS